MQHLVRRSPRVYGCAQTRWTLAGLQQSGTWLDRLTLGGIHRVLDRLGVVWKRAREAVYSPDREYQAKLAWVAALRQQVASSGTEALVYLDEVTIGRQPTVSNAYAASGHAQARAQRSHHSDTLTRVVATLDAADGRVVARRATRIDVSGLVQFYRQLQTAYPGRRLWVVQDNWPVHTHPDLLVALEAQQSPFAWHRPGHWSLAPSAGAVRRWGGLQLPMQIVPLPTYASWTNPIEKLWRKLRQDVTHLHPWAEDLARLRAEIDAFLAQFAHGSTPLLRYVGLLPD